MAQRIAALGLGCASLPFGRPRAASAVLEAAFDLGVRHFDVARLYGLGGAESLVGGFLRGKRDQVTLVTKFGLNAYPLTGKGQLKGAVRRALSRIPFADSVLAAVRPHREPVPPSRWRGQFDLPTARLSLETSLRELRTDHVDWWLLHEAHAEDAAQPELLAFLDDVQRQGKIRRYGIASTAVTTLNQADRFPQAYGLFQFDNDVLTRHRAQFTRSAEMATHGALRPFAECAARLQRDPGSVAAFLEATGIDLAQPEQLRGCLLAWAIEDNLGGKVLFGTSSGEHVRSNLAALGDARLTREALSRFASLWR